MFTLLGLLSSFIGMGGLVLTIVSLFPLNGYNIFLTSSAIIKLILFEYDRISKTITVVNQQQQYLFNYISGEAVLYLSFLIASIVASILHNITTIVCFCQCQWLTLRNSEADVEDESIAGATTTTKVVTSGNATKSLVISNSQQLPQQSSLDTTDEHKKLENGGLDYYDSHSACCHRRRQRKSWFVRLICLTFMTEVFVALFGTHLTLNKVKEIDAAVIPLTVQTDTLLSCGLLWISCLSTLFFAFVILFASFCILIGSYQEKGHKRSEGRRARRASRRRSTRSSSGGSGSTTIQREIHAEGEDSETRPLLLS